MIDQMTHLLFFSIHKIKGLTIFSNLYLFCLRLGEKEPSYGEILIILNNQFNRECINNLENIQVRLLDGNTILGFSSE